MHSPYILGVLRSVGCVILCLSVNSLASAQAERTKQITQEILNASKENRTFISISHDGYHLTAGLHLLSVPADGESLVWGIVTLTDATGKPVPNAVVELNATAGTIRLIEPHPLTDSEGVFIFALQSTISPSSFQIRINFPQFGIGGTLSGTFCRIGDPGCFLPRTCAGISAAWEYYPVENDVESLTCATTVADAYQFYASDAPEPPTIYFDYVTFKNDRPEGAFPERRLYLSYTECRNIFGYDQFCRCLQGFKEGVSDYTYGWGRTFGEIDYGLPNGENVAEVTYLQYQAGSPGRVCKKEFRFQASSPLVRLSNEWVIFTDENPTPTVEVEIRSPHWQGDMWLTLQYGPYIPEQRRQLVQVPGRYTFTLERSLYSRVEKNTPYQVQAVLRADMGYAYEVTTSDTTESFVRMDELNVRALGYNPQSKTFDFAVSYRLSCTRPQFTRTPLVSQGYIGVYYGKRPDTDFFNRPIVHLARIERNGALSGEEAGHWLWPGPKLEFRWVEITHQTGETADRTYWYTMREVASGSPVYLLTATRGTKRYAVAVTNPHWDYYLVGGIGRIPKNLWSLYVNGNTKINHATARAAMRISAREHITGSDTNYRLRLLEWATAFIGAKYDWGGCWFGGRVHPTVKDGDYYNGFGLDCSKLISATAMLSGMRWWDSQRYGRRNQRVRWWNVGTVHIREDALPLTQRWDSATEARNQVSPGDVIISKKHVAYLYSIVRQSTEVDRQGVVTKRYVWELQVIDASGGDDPKTKHHVEGYNEVRISDGTHLLSNSLILQVAASERDYNGARRMNEWVDMLRALEKRGYSFRRIRETSN